MQEIEIGSHKYRTGTKLNAFDQFHIFRKLAPLFSGMGETFNQMPTNANPDGGIPKGFWTALEPVAQSLSEMSKEDSEFVLRTCLLPCMRVNEIGQWTRIMAPDGQFMFEDIDAMTMLQLVWAVVQENLGGFFGAAAGVPNGSAEEGDQPSLTLR